MITINFTDQELAFIINLLGDLPTKTNAFIVLNSINAQLQEQMANKEAPEEKEA